MGFISWLFNLEANHHLPLTDEDVIRNAKPITSAIISLAPYQCDDGTRIAKSLETTPTRRNPDN